MHLLLETELDQTLQKVQVHTERRQVLSVQGHAASGAPATAAGAAPDGSGYSTDVRSIMMLIHAAEELHGGPSAYVEAGITDLDKPITTIRAFPT